ncbi:MAG: transposase [Candidatus Aminicenantes bacterium]|nr:transposase [Candidatus Aminicenantes bacterium]
MTICIKNKEANCFGKIANGKIEFSQLGKITNTCWLEIPTHFPQVKLDDFVIMPDHVHGIIVILAKAGDEIIHSHFSNQFSNRSKMDLSKIIQTFKASVTRQINKDQTNEYFAWQKSFYDHMINNYKELVQIRQYIKENPTIWSKNDKEFENLFN